MSKGMMETLLASQSSEALGAQRVKRVVLDPYLRAGGSSKVFDPFGG